MGIALQGWFGDAEEPEELGDVAGAWWALEDLAKDWHEVVNASDRRQGRVVRVVSKATGGREDESVLDGEEGDAFIVEPGSELAVGATHLAMDTRRSHVPLEELAHVCELHGIGLLGLVLHRWHSREDASLHDVPARLGQP